MRKNSDYLLRMHTKSIASVGGVKPAFGPEPRSGRSCGDLYWSWFVTEPGGQVDDNCS